MLSSFHWSYFLPKKKSQSVFGGLSRVTGALSFFRKEMSLLNFSNVRFHCAEHLKQTSSHIHYHGVEAEISSSPPSLHHKHFDDFSDCTYSKIIFQSFVLLNVRVRFVSTPPGLKPCWIHVQGHRRAGYRNSVHSEYTYNNRPISKNVSCSRVKCEFVTNGKWEWLTPPLTMKTVLKVNI